MRVCVVGQGPSAEGKNEEIDACDFVVRLRGFWRDAAEDSGIKINAHAYFGWPYGKGRPALTCEQWYTHCPEQIAINGDTGIERLTWFVETANLGTARMLTNGLWRKLYSHIGSHPSTGIVAVAMALERFRGCELVLYGFDSTLPELPNFWDARQDPDHATLAHDILSEKIALAAIEEGMWLGEPTHVTLEWPDKPDIDAAIAKRAELETQAEEDQTFPDIPTDGDC